MIVVLARVGKGHEVFLCRACTPENEGQKR